MIKRFLVAFSLFLSVVSLAQEGTSSPYSFYGLGDMRFKGTVENRSMGGLSVLADSIHINIQNPAFYPALKFTTFTIGGSYLTTKLKTSSDEGKARRSNLDYMAVAFPIGDFGAGFGLVPFTSVGYKLQTLATPENPQGKKYTGTGGINKVYFGGGYEINKNFSFGLEFGYHFGSIETSSTYAIADVQLGTREINESAVSGAGFTTGISYKGKINTKLDFYSSASFAPAATMSLSNERSIATVQFLATGGIRVIDDEDIPVADTKVKVPAKFSIGSGIGVAKKWMLGAEVTLNHNSNLGNRFSDIEEVEFENAIKYNIGGYFIPQYTSFSDYWKRMTYRAGLRYENTGLIINDESIKDVGVTLGLGFPLGGTFSNINVGFEFGKRGTTNAGLIQENYMNFTAALSLNDRWFVKRKYD